MAKILITGGTGLIGQHLIKHLINLNHEVAFLSRGNANHSNLFKVFKWDLDKNYIDEMAFDGIEHIIHLAGEGIADKRWNKKRKKEIIDSRVNSSKLLAHYVDKMKLKPISFVGSSAVGIYGTEANEKVFSEQDNAASDFLASVCLQWEKSYEPFIKMGIKTSIVRTGIVLAKNGGVYPKVSKPIKLGLGTVFGSGKQYMPWIHIHDLIHVYSELIASNLPSGIYNGVASEHVNNDYFMKSLARSIHRKIFLPHTPAFILKLALGEMSSILLTGLKVSNAKLLENNFKFEFNDLKSAFANISGKN